jgi:hypothetical protein
VRARRGPSRCQCRRSSPLKSCRRANLDEEIEHFAIKRAHDPRQAFSRRHVSALFVKLNLAFADANSLGEFGLCQFAINPGRRVMTFSTCKHVGGKKCHKFPASGPRPRKSPQRGLRAADNRHPLEKLPRAPSWQLAVPGGMGSGAADSPPVMGGLSRPP